MLLVQLSSKKFGICFCGLALGLISLCVWVPENYDPASSVIQKQIFAASVVAIAIFSFSLIWLFSPHIPIKLDKFDLLIILFLWIEVLINYYHNVVSDFSFNAQTGLIIALICAKLSFFNQLKSKVFIWVMFVVTQLTFVSQAFYGLVQYVNSSGNNASINTTGSFHNSGILGCYLAVSVVSASEMLLYIEPRKRHSFAFLAIIASIVLTSLVLILTQSRIAWIACLAGLFSMCLLRFRDRIRLSFAKIPMNAKVVLLAALFTLLTLFAVWIYQIKERSAQGRFLMWRVELDMIRERPVLGYGETGFCQYYGMYQAKHFLSTNNDIEKSVAGNPANPFSDYLGMIIKYGITAILIFVLLVGCVLTDCKSIPFFKPTLVTCLVLGVASYTLDGMPTLINFFLALFACSWFLQRRYYVSPNIIRGCAIFAGAYSIFLLSLTVRAGKLSQLSSEVHHQLYLGSDTAVSQVVKIIADSEQLIKSDAAMLAIYGKCLALVGRHEKAIQMYREALDLRSDFSVFDNLGISYQSLGQYDAAMNSFALSHNMVPNRLRSQYLIVKLYVETNRIKEAKLMAQQILNTRDRIMSYQAYLYREEMKEILRKSND